ncbi:MAG: Omp28-related outer membrane protein [Bacteroidales bacterium]|nr:Omp28-related outer membrane protein [Bacteroidales bacterium]
MKRFYFLFITAIALILTITSSYGQCPGEVEVKIRLHTDNYGSETTWVLKHATDTTVYASGGPYQNITGGQLFLQNVCVPNDEPLVFRINDSYGDGICCSYGQGYYEVELFGYIYASGGQFVSYEESYFVATQPPTRDMSVNALDVLDYYGIGNVELKGNVKNWGTDTVTSYKINYSVNNAAPETYEFTGTHIAPFSSLAFTHPVSYNATTSGPYALKFWISQVNGNTDLNHSNDTIEGSFVVVSQIPPKFVLLEQATGAWCGYCPDGSVKIEQILQSNPNVIAAAVHNGDGMAFTYGNTVNSTFVSGYPAGMIDRFKFSDIDGVGMGRGFWNIKTAERMQHVSPVEVNVANTYNTSTRQVSITLTAVFYTNLDKDIRFNCFIVEDSLTGTGANWDQVNNYDTASNHPMFGLGNPITDYVHRHVVRAMLAGPFGEQGSLPSPIVEGQTYTKIYTYTLPLTMKEEDVRIIGLVQQYDTDKNKRTIFNSKQVGLDGFVNVSDLDYINELSIYPNPFNDFSTIVFSIKEQKNTEIALYNVLGQKVFGESKGLLSPGYHYQTISASGLPKGIYNCVITFDQDIVSRKIVIQ